LRNHFDQSPRLRFAGPIAARFLLGALVLLAFGHSVGADESPGPESLKNVRLGPDDVAVRIHYRGNLAVYSTWLTLTRRESVSSVDYLVTYDIVAIPKPTTLSPVLPWDSIWKEMDSERIYDLHGSGNEPKCQERSFPVDSDAVEVEVRRGAQYRKYLYSDPLSGRCPEVRHMASTLRYLQRAFANQLPLPYQSANSSPNL
jgi:hypothetical protein